MALIYVTHDQVDMTLADKIVVLRRIEQVGAPMDLYRDPDNKFVAGFIGSPSMNFVNGVVGGAVESAALKQTIAATENLPADGTEVLVGLRASTCGPCGRHLHR